MNDEVEWYSVIFPQNVGLLVFFSSKHLNNVNNKLIVKNSIVIMRFIKIQKKNFNMDCEIKNACCCSKK